MTMKTPAVTADVEALAAMTGVAPETVQLAAEGVARRLVALFGSAEQAAAQMNDATVKAALIHHRQALRLVSEDLMANPGQVLRKLHACA